MEQLEHHLYLHRFVQAAIQPVKARMSLPAQTSFESSLDKVSERQDLTGDPIALSIHQVWTDFASRGEISEQEAAKRLRSLAEWADHILKEAFKTTSLELIWWPLICGWPSLLNLMGRLGNPNPLLFEGLSNFHLHRIIASNSLFSTMPDWISATRGVAYKAETVMGNRIHRFNTPGSRHEITLTRRQQQLVFYYAETENRKTLRTLGLTLQRMAEPATLARDPKGPDEAGDPFVNAWRVTLQCANMESFELERYLTESRIQEEMFADRIPKGRDAEGKVAYSLRFTPAGYKPAIRA